LASWAFAVAFSLPAVVCVYSAAWFIGFVGFTMRVTSLIPTIYFTEKYFLTGRHADAGFAFLFLLLAYTAHPFATFFWLFWCFCRSMTSRRMSLLWKFERGIFF